MICCTKLRVLPLCGLHRPSLRSQKTPTADTTLSPEDIQGITHELDGWESSYSFSCNNGLSFQTRITSHYYSRLYCNFNLVIWQCGSQAHCTEYNARWSLGGLLTATRQPWLTVHKTFYRQLVQRVGTGWGKVATFWICHNSHLQHIFT